jgi:hypothetical protein
LGRGRLAPLLATGVLSFLRPFCTTSSKIVIVFYALKYGITYPLFTFSALAPSKARLYYTHFVLKAQKNPEFCKNFVLIALVFVVFKPNTGFPK